MKVYKFGGAALSSPSSIRQVLSIVKAIEPEPLLIVVSAMAKTTNALESVLHEFSASGTRSELQKVRKFHVETALHLFASDHPVFDDLEKTFSAIEENLALSLDYDALYDQVIPLGEMLSSTILHHFLLAHGVPSKWIDARQCIMTDDTFREGTIDWTMTCDQIRPLNDFLPEHVLLTQGFIGRSISGLTTTLGREGSDFSAAIFASCLNAESVTIWKDVPGVMSADPRRIPGAQVFKELPYKEAAEMTYYGASVIHPKTIKPLANRRIPLLVKSFVDPSLPGTIIRECTIPQLPPLIIFKENQCLISCRVTDYTFVSEPHLATIFEALTSLNTRINLMQNSAISFSFCVDFSESKIPALIQKLHQTFEVVYNAGLTLVTVKNYDSKTFDHYRTLNGVLMEQSSRSTLQVLIKSRGDSQP